MANEPEQLEIDIREDLEVGQRATLVAKLEQETGVVSAWFAGGDHHRLTIHFEPEHFSHETLLDTIELHGFHGKIVEI
jgi:cyanophycinase-like exopeptidase